MSTRTHDASSVEAAAAALLKAVTITMKGSDVVAAFERISAPDLVKGHAWRAIKRAIGGALPMKWQRAASTEQAHRMLQAAARLAEQPRRLDPRERHQYAHSHGPHRLGDLRRLVDGYVAGRVAGKLHADLGKFCLPVEAVRAPKAPPAKPFDIRDRARALKAEGRRTGEIVRLTGLSRSTVQRTFRAAA